MYHHGKCPKCNSDWDAGSIFDTLRPQRWCEDKTDEELQQYVEQHYAPPYRFSRIIGIEYRDKYDGVWEYACPDCNARFPRFGEPNGRTKQR
jgi:hypothetical protein